MENIAKAQGRYKHYYDKNTVQHDYRTGDWVFIRFPAVETNRNRKLSHPWHGPYRILHRRDPDITAAKVYFPEDGQLQVHQQRVTKCPPELIAGYYWYGPRKCSNGKIPHWVAALNQPQLDHTETTTMENVDLSEELNAPDTNINVDPSGLEHDVDSPVTDNEDTDPDVIESTGLTVLHRSTPHTCNYNLRNKITIPQRYQ